VNGGGAVTQAAFGFVIVASSPPRGNFAYHDDLMDVRIKGLSYSSLNVTSGVCGPRTHATFTGMASVIRSTGTTIEPFTVTVDDCAEPGMSADTFGITTRSYSNGPLRLIRGNIQIHGF
jgi:hypothetical protein